MAKRDGNRRKPPNSGDGDGRQPFGSDDGRNPHHRGAVSPGVSHEYRAEIELRLNHYDEADGEVNLSGCAVDDKNVGWTTVRLALLEGLSKLDLTLCEQLTDLGVLCISRLPLQTLYLSGCNRITETGLKHVARLPLQSLYLAGCKSVTDVAIEGFARRMPSLTLLDLSWCEQVTDEGLAHLTRLRLLELSLSGCSRVTDGGLAHVAKLPLRVLYLSGCERIGDADALVELLRQLTVTSRNGGRVDALKAVFVSGCHFSWPDKSAVPTEVLKITSPARLLAELLRLRPANGGSPGGSKTERLHWLRATILGRQEIGKSHLWVRLNNGGDLDRDVTGRLVTPPKTQDWESRVLPLERAGPDDADVQLMFFDLGGDPEMHGSHRTFLRDERNLYIVMCNASVPRDEGMVDYWMRVVRAYGRYHRTGRPDERRQAPAVLVMSFRDEGVHDDFAPDRVNEVSLAAAHRLTHVQIVREYWEPTGKPRSDNRGQPVPNRRRTQLAVEGHPSKLSEVESAIRRAVASLHDEINVAYPKGFDAVVRLFAEGGERSPVRDGPIPLQNVRDEFYKATGNDLDKTSDVGPRLLSNLGLILCPLLDDEDDRHRDWFHAGDRTPRPPPAPDDVVEQVDDLAFGVQWLRAAMYAIVRKGQFAHSRGVVKEDDLLAVLVPLIGGRRDLARKTLALLRVERLVFKYRGTASKRYLIVDRLPREDESLRESQLAEFASAWRWTMTVPMLLESHLPQFVGAAFSKLDSAADLGSNVCRDAVRIKWRDNPSVVGRLTMDLNRPAIHLAVKGGKLEERDTFVAQLQLMMRDVVGDELVGGEGVFKEDETPTEHTHGPNGSVGQGESKECLAKRAEALVNRLGFFPKKLKDLAEALDCADSSLLNAIKVSGFLAEQRELTKVIHPPRTRAGVSVETKQLENASSENASSGGDESDGDIERMYATLNREQILDQLAPYAMGDPDYRKKLDAVSIEHLARRLMLIQRNSRAEP